MPHLIIWNYWYCTDIKFFTCFEVEAMCLDTSFLCGFDQALATLNCQVRKMLEIQQIQFHIRSVLYDSEK